MAGHFTIGIDSPRNLLRVCMSGFYSVEDVQRYHAAVDEASIALGGPPSRQRMICDVTEMRIQAQDVVAAFQQVMGDPKYRARRVAFVVATSLARMQVQRVAGDRVAQLFDNEADAEAWLDSSEGEKASAA